jgi:hypothetical protein
MIVPSDIVEALGISHIQRPRLRSVESFRVTVAFTGKVRRAALNTKQWRECETS